MKIILKANIKILQICTIFPINIASWLLKEITIRLSPQGGHTVDKFSHHYVFASLSKSTAT